MRGITGLKRRWDVFAKCFLKTEEGAVAIYVALVSALMIGFGALVVDLGRLFALQTELQAAADSTALVAAAELDGTSGARARARLAANNNPALAANLRPLDVTNKQAFANGGQDIIFDTTTDLRFLNGLPNDDDIKPIPASFTATSDQSARFVQVTVTARQVDYLLAPVLAARIGGDGTGPTSGQATAVAVAGFKQAVCQITPLMICNPDEGTPPGNLDYNPDEGEIVRAKFQGAGAGWGPGAFGLLDPPGGFTGGPAVANGLASTSPDNCFSGLVEVRTGQAVGPVDEGLNTRFDMYSNGGNLNQYLPAGVKPNEYPNYKPSSNVLKGKYKSNPTQWDNYPMGSPPSASAGMPLPAHACFIPDDCVASTGSDGPNFAPAPDLQTWKDYFAVNHPTVDTSTWSTLGDMETFLGSTSVNPANPIVTRREVYDWENSTGIPVADINNDSTYGNDDALESHATYGENGKPMHYDPDAGSSPVDPTPDPLRRVVHVAVINCIANGPIQNSGGPYPVEAYAKMFLVRPVDNPSVGDLYVEMQEILQPGVDDNVLHDIVQLYR